MNSLMSSESQFHVVHCVTKFTSLKMCVSSVQVGGNVDQSKYNTWLRSIQGNKSKGIQIDTSSRSGLFEIMFLIVV